MFRHFLIATQFLTSFPIKIKGEIIPQDNGRSLLFYPVIGLLLGLFLFLLSSLLPASDLSAALLLCVWIFLTGALHLDGLADSADAWMGGHSDPARTLTIMKDPACGAIAVVTLILVLLLKWTAIKILLTSDSYLIIFSPIIARMMVVVLIMTTPYVRDFGLGTDMKEYLPKQNTIYVLLGFSLLLFLISFNVALISLIVSFTTMFLLRHFMLRRIKGFTGDTAGATIEVVELTVLLTITGII